MPRDDTPPERPKFPRAMTSTQRDNLGIPAKKERLRSPARGVAINPFVEEEITAQYEGDERREKRSLRPPDKRLERLEIKHDKLSQDVTETRVLVGEMTGKLDAIGEDLRAMRQVRVERQITDIHIDETRQRTQIEDDAHRKRSRRKFWLSVISLFTSGGIFAIAASKLAGC